MIVQELHEIQHRCGYLPKDELQRLAGRINVPLRRLHEVASHFPLYRLDPPPTVDVKVCRDLTRHLVNLAAVALEKTRATEVAEQKIRESLKYVFERNARCGLCHFFDVDPTDYTVTDFKPANLEEVWFESAHFDHAAHRAVDCRECHAEAYDVKKLDVSLDFSDEVMLPGIAVCQKCHAPAGSDSNGQPLGGARHDCTECHDYHNRDHSTMGRGAGQREAQRPSPDAPGFLSGRR